MLFVFMTLSQTLVSNVHASSEIDNWPENDAWLNIELISWEANQSIEWDNNGGLPDPQFRICIEADSESVDCINTPTWDDQYSLSNVWNYSIDIPDESNILKITIECEDNDALNDDECDMNNDIAEWKLFYEYNWSSNPVVEYSSSGNEDETNNWKDAASNWTFKIGGFGDEDNDGVQDLQDICPGFDDSNDFDNDGTPDGCDEDDDGDGTLDEDDLCPNTPLGAIVDWGCPMDSDEDGVYDGLDLCPESIGHAGVDSDGCDLDSDSDGIPDFDDSCPDTPIGEDLVNGLNSLGCSSSQIDTDGDGVNDSIDICPNSIGLAGVDSDGCDLDSDSDGIPDFDDSCRNTPLGHAVDYTGCSDYQKDSDGDGVVDALDACANTPYPPNHIDPSGPIVITEDKLEGNLTWLPDHLGCSINQYFELVDPDGDNVYNYVPPHLEGQPGNYADKCPNTPAGETVDYDGCSASQTDFDGDGIMDIDDPETDWDSDGFVLNDKCPMEAGTSTQDLTGCPDSDGDGWSDYYVETDDASSSTDSTAGVVCFLGILGIIGVVLFMSKGSKKKEVNRVRKPISGDRFSPVPGKMPVRQPNQQEMMQKLENERRYAQQQVMQLQQQLNQSNQLSASQLSSLQSQMQQMQANIEQSEKAKAELEEKLQKAEKGKTIVQNITYNIQDSAISGDINSTVNSNDQND